MSNLSELLPAGAGAKSADFVASGTLGSGVTVALNSDGTVTAVAAGGPESAAPVSFSASSISVTPGSAYHATANKVIVFYRNTVSTYPTAVVGTVSGTAISFGSENLITTGTLTAGNISGTNITGTGATHTLGTIQISGNTISSTDSTAMIIDDNVSLSSGKTLTLDKISSANTFIDFGTINLSTDGHYYTATTGTGGFIFEGATPDSSETSLYAIDPTADRTIALPDESGTIITTGSTDAITESMMGTDSIGQNELKTLVTLQILNSSGTVLKTLYGAGA